jgi:hypothetical protein
MINSNYCIKLFWPEIYYSRAKYITPSKNHGLDFMDEDYFDEYCKI